MATVSGRVIFDRDRSATFSNGDSGLGNIPIVLQNVITTDRLIVLTDSDGNYTFLNVPNGAYRIVESYGAVGGVPTPGDFAAAAPGNIPQGINPPITAALNPPAGSTNLDSVTPDTLLVTVTDPGLTNQNFYNGPVIYTPIETILDPCAVVSGNNLIAAADNGTFGSFPQGSLANTGAPIEPYPGVTPDFTYVLPNPDVYTPAGGEYTVQNIMNNAMSEQIGAWWRIADHTTGNETGRMMVVNGFNPGAAFFRTVVNVQPNTNYLFTAWILNLFKVEGFPNPELGVRVVGQNGGVLYSATLGTQIPVNVNAPEWKEIGTVVNSRDNTSLLVEFISEGPEVIGNDYAIDDISFNEILIPEFLPVKAVNNETPDVGDTVTYTVTLSNTCASPLTDVFFWDAVPNGLSFVNGSLLVNGALVPDADPNAGFPLPDVPGGGTVTVAFQALVANIPVPNPALNAASIDYFYTPVEGGIPGEFTVISNEVPVEVAVQADLSVVKTASPSPAVAEAILTYTMIVSNAGPTSAVNTLLTDRIPPELMDVEFSTDGGATFAPWGGSLGLGVLGAGESRTVLIRGTVRPLVTGEIVNSAVVSSDTPDPDPDNNVSTVVTTVVPVADSADLSITKSSAPDPVQPGGVLTYTLTIFNGGPSPAVNTILIDQVPGGVTNAEYSLNGGMTWQPWTGTLSLGTLGVGSTVTVLIRGTILATAGGDIVNTSTVSSDTPDPDLSNNTDTAVTNIPTAASADVSVVKSGQPPIVRPGETLTYTITVANQGPDDAENVILSDEIPPQLETVQFSTDGGVTWSPWTGFLSLGLLTAGQNRTILIRGMVSDSASGFISNTAVVRSDTPDPDPLNNTSIVDTPVEAATDTGADLCIRKTVSPDPAACGERLTYRLTVFNAGPDVAEQVLISDNLTDALSSQCYSLDNGQTYHPWMGSVNVGDLAPSQSVSILISAVITECAQICIKNTAVVSSDTDDPNLLNNRDTAVVKLCDCTNPWDGCPRKRRS